MALNRTYRIIVDHKRIPSDEYDYHEWYLTGKTFRRDVLGRINGGWEQWLHVKCNNSDCPADGLISAAAITALLPTDDDRPNKPTNMRGGE